MTDIEIKTRGIYDSLNPSEQKAASYFLQNVSSVFDEPIAVLAKKSGSSQGCWVRFCKSLGFAGLKDMKKNLIAELHSADEEPTIPENLDFLDTHVYAGTDDIVRGYEATVAESVRGTAALQKSRTLEKAAERMVKATSIRLFGVGASGIVAEDFYYKLLRIGRNVIFSSDLHMQLTYAISLSKKDIALFISNSGKTPEIVELAKEASKRDATLISITKYGMSPLSKLSDFVLPTSSPEPLQRSGAMSSRIAALFAADLLFTTLCNKNYDEVAKPLMETYATFSKSRIYAGFNQMI